MRWIETYTGEKFDVFSPQKESVKLADIAHSLSQKCRFAGQCSHFYSVAQHSIYIQQVLANQGYDAEVQLYGLLHDANEAYLPDLPSPIKAHIPQYHEIEERVQNVIWEAFRLPLLVNKTKEIVKRADTTMLEHEARVLMKCKDWNHSGKLVEGIEISFQPMMIVEFQFLYLANQLIQAYRPIKRIS